MEGWVLMAVIELQHTAWRLKRESWGEGREEGQKPRQHLLGPLAGSPIYRVASGRRFSKTTNHQSSIPSLWHFPTNATGASSHWTRW